MLWLDGAPGFPKDRLFAGAMLQLQHTGSARLLPDPTGSPEPARPPAF